MASDTLSDRQSSLRSRGKERPTGSPTSLWDRRVTLGVITFTVTAVLISAAYLLVESAAPRDLVRHTTHRIRRGNLLVTVTEQGTLESSNNLEIKCTVRGDNIITWVVESGTEVKPGDELVRLDTLLIDEEIIERTMYYHLAQSEAERSRADVVRAELAISEYLQGRFVSALAELEKNLAVAESRLRTSRNMLDHAQMMSESGYVSDLDVEEKEFAVAQADLAVKLVKTEIEVLKRFTKMEQLATLQGDSNAAKAKHEADKERAYADERRLRRAKEELGHCVVRAERGGMVIYPSAEAWKNAPEIEEGATVHKDQVLLLMPDLSRMQVKVGIHESMIDRIQPGLDAKVTLTDRALEAKVSSVATVTRPAGWWTGNVVKYDTIIELPSVEGLKPGMTAEVGVVLARYEDVLIIPTAGVVETDQEYACWVTADNEIQRRSIELGDSSDMFIVVKSGLQEGDEVVLHPLDTVEEAQAEAAKTLDETNSRELEFYDF